MNSPVFKNTEISEGSHHDVQHISWLYSSCPRQQKVIIMLYKRYLDYNPLLLCCLGFVNLIYTRTRLEERITTIKCPPSDWNVGMMGIFSSLMFIMRAYYGWHYSLRSSPCWYKKVSWANQAIKEFSSMGSAPAPAWVLALNSLNIIMKSG